MGFDNLYELDVTNLAIMIFIHGLQDTLHLQSKYKDQRDSKLRGPIILEAFRFDLG